jgi:hypothetical protein
MTSVATNCLSQDLFAKIDEQIRRLLGIISRLPAGNLHWRPSLPQMPVATPRSVGELLGHLLQCLAGFVAVLYAVRPDEFSHFLELRQRPVNHFCQEAEALERISEYRDYLGQGFRLLTDEQLAHVIPTVFVKEGETVLTLLLGNFEHLVNHKHELFMYAKFLGVPLASADLYQFRTELPVQPRSGVPDGGSS